jgi:hypothetical protein
VAKTNPALNARRADVERLAEKIDRLCDELRNDPTNDKPWSLIQHFAREMERQAGLGGHAAVTAQKRARGENPYKVEK